MRRLRFFKRLGFPVRRDWMLRNPMNKLLISTFVSILLLNSAAADSADFKRTEDVIYGRKFGTALTMDIFQPSKPNGSGIAFMVSGGWFSAHESINPVFYSHFSIMVTLCLRLFMAHNPSSAFPKSRRTSIEPSASSGTTRKSTASIPTISAFRARARGVICP